MDSLATPAVRLAVLPVESAAGAAEEDYFARGFVEDLITDLSRFPNLGLISPRSTFASNLAELGDEEIAEELGIEFLLKAGFRKRAEEVRLNAQLLNPRSGEVLWAEVFDAPVGEVFGIQDQVVEQVTAALSKRIDAATLQSARRKPLTELAAYDCWLRGYDCLRAGTLEADEEAREFFERALEIDPHYARAHAGLSLTYFNEWSCQLWERSEISECMAYEHANRALQFDDTDHVTHLVLGRVFLYRGHPERATQHIDRAYELNPNDADSLVQLASCKAFLGEGEEAEKLFERALQLNPYREPWYFANGALILFAMRRYEECLEYAMRAPLTTTWVDLPLFIAICHAQLGNEEEVGKYREIFLKCFVEKITRGREPEPGEAARFVLTVNPFCREEDRAHYVESLKKAGLSFEAEESVAAVATGSEGEERVFALEGDQRVAVFEGSRIELPEVKGFKDIATLLERAGEEVHSSELMGGAASFDGGADAVDMRARAEYGERIRELQGELVEAEANHDAARVESIRAELDPLMDHLAAAVGLGGRARKLGAEAERHRTAVTWRIRSAIRKIEAKHPDLGKHFANSVRTGTFCSYSPEKPGDWRLE